MERRKKNAKWIVLAVTALSLAAVAFPPTASADEPAATLTCTMQSSNAVTIFNVNVDYAHKTVNGDAAQIEPLLVSWTDRSGRRWGLVRNTGTLCELQDAVTCIQRGSCERAATKF